MPPTVSKKWILSRNDMGFDGLKLCEVQIPEVGDDEVLVKLNATTLNYRDLAIAKGIYPHPYSLPVVPLSDGAGKVVGVGRKVWQFKKGDRVSTMVLQRCLYGPLTPDTWPAIGGNLDGTLRQYAVFPATGLVRSPRNLTDLEAAALPGAGITAWNCLYGLKQVKPGEVVLTQGTGGVSVFGLQFAKAAGATVIATTSSADKVEKLKRLGADHVINYKEDLHWGKTARALTRGGEGVDHIIDVGGARTMEQSMEAIKFEGVINITGFLGGQDVSTSVFECLMRVCTARGLVGGNRAMMEDMIAAIEANDIHPVVDARVFSFEHVKQAYQYLWDANHIGKVAIKIE